MADNLRDRFNNVAELLDGAEHDVLGHMAFDESLRSKVHSTNPLERVNKEIKGRTNVDCIYPNREAVVRLVGALMPEQDDVYGSPPAATCPWKNWQACATITLRRP